MTQMTLLGCDEFAKLHYETVEHLIYKMERNIFNNTNVEEFNIGLLVDALDRIT